MMQDARKLCDDSPKVERLSLSRNKAKSRRMCGRGVMWVTYKSEAEFYDTRDVAFCPKNILSEGTRCWCKQ